MRIRNYLARDAEAIGDLYERSVREIAKLDYSAQQIDAWAGRRLSAARCEELMGDGRWRFVAVDHEDKLLAFIDLERDGHIDFLYRDPQATGIGIASSLYDHVEALGRQYGIERLYSEASEAAKRFFLKKGFVVLHRRDFEIDGTPIHNYAVEKRLGVAEQA